MALAKSTKRGELIVANTSNVKEMKNGRPVNVKLGEAAENCVIVELVAVVDNGENDHVFTTKILAAGEVNAAVKAGTAYLVVAPEIMVEEARRTDGHIGKFRFEKDGVYTAYQLNVHDRIEVSTNHRYFNEAGQEVGKRPMATGLIIQPQASGELFNGSELEMKKIELGVLA